MVRVQMHYTSLSSCSARLAGTGICPLEMGLGLTVAL